MNKSFTKRRGLVADWFQSTRKCVPTALAAGRSVLLRFSLAGVARLLARRNQSPPSKTPISGESGYNSDARCRCSSTTLSRLFLATILAILYVASTANFATAVEPEVTKLEKLLDRLGLTELQIVHLEDKLAVPGNRAAKVALAKELADSYVDILLASASDEKQFADYAQRVRRLTSQWSEIDSPTLQVMLLQAEYLRAEKLVTKWLEDRSQSAALAEAGKVLDPIVPKLQTRRKEITETINRLNDELGEDENEELDRKREERIDKLTQVGFRATYFCGWASYYLGISVGDTKKAEQQFVDARECFADILAIDTEREYKEELDSEWLELGSIWLARSILGLGMAEIALGEEANSRICFNLLAEPLVPKSLRSQSGYWQLQGWLNIGQYARAEQIAAQLLSERSSLSESQRSGICVSLVRAAYSQKESNNQLVRLGRIGVSGLMQLRQFPLLISMLDQYEASPEESGFYSAWLTGYRIFLKAEETKDNAAFASSAKKLQSALESPDAGGDVKSLAICRYHLAWARYRLEEMDPAERLLQKAIPTLKLVDPQLALQASWLRFEALNDLAKTNESRKPDALTALQKIIDEFPGTQFARNAEYQLARLKRSSSSPEQVIKDLESITSDNPNYISARYEICLLNHQLWQKFRTDGEAAAPIAARTFEAVDRFLRESKGGRHEQRLRVTLIAIDISLRSIPVDAERAKRYFELATAAESHVSSGSTAVIEFHYHKFQLARATGDAAAVDAEAQWLAENGAGTAYQKSAIVQLARTIDQRIAATTGEERLEQIRQAVKVYNQMVSLFGSDTDRLKKDKNSRVALSKLSSYQMELKMFKEAATNMQKLVDAFPSDQNYLRKCGMAQFQAGDYEAALPHWRKLTKGLKSNSEKWFEAKYHLMYSLAKTDPTSAKGVYRQFATLYPNLEEPWKTKFAEVGNMVGN